MLRTLLRLKAAAGGRSGRCVASQPTSSTSLATGKRDIPALRAGAAEVYGERQRLGDLIERPPSRLSLAGDSGKCSFRFAAKRHRRRRLI